jgi:hypothetical protein
LWDDILFIFFIAIKCDATDDSMYCTIMKLFNMLVVFLIVVYVAYIAYNLFGPTISSRKRR